MKTSPLTTKYGGEKRWLKWRLEERDGKPTKVPYIIGTESYGKSTDPATWKTLKGIKEDKLGIVLTDGKLTCIDIDKVVKDGKLDNVFIQELLASVDTFVEYSQSGTGFHIWFTTEEPLKIVKNKKAPFEVYNTGRYICTTGDQWGDVDYIRTLTQEEALALINSVVPQVEEKKAATETYLDIQYRLEDSEVIAALQRKDKTKRLYDGDSTDFANDASRGDASLMNSLAFWTAKDPEQMKRIFMGSKRGKREKVVTREDYYVGGLIRDAISFTKEVYKPPQLDLVYTVDKNGARTYILNTENIYRVLTQHKEFRGLFRYDEFTDREYIHDTEWREIADSDYIKIQTRISVLFPHFSKLSKEMTKDAISKAMYEHKIDSGKEFIESLEWDKVARLDSWLNIVYGTPMDAYHKAVGSNWLKGLASRLANPGCKFDYVLVLEGKQGIKKSWSLRALVGDDKLWEVNESVESKDFIIKMQGMMIVEFTEGDVLTKHDVRKMKSIITSQVDRIRKPYQRNAIDYKRRCVFAMSTNDEEYLKDDTGNRRWLPIKVEKETIDIEWLEQNRLQLLAEAYHRAVKLKETTWEFPEDTVDHQNERIVRSPNSDIVCQWYYNLEPMRKSAGITVNDAYREVFFGMSPQGGTPIGAPYSHVPRMDKKTENEIISIFKIQIKLEKKRVMYSGNRTWRWFTQGEEVSLETDYQQKEKEAANNF